MGTVTVTVLALLAAVVLTGGQELTEQTCTRARHEVVIQEDAQAFIAGFFAMHYETTEGGYRCGDINSYALQPYEAIRWALDRLNKKDEMLNGQLLTDTYVPGIKLGMIVRDYCSDSLNMAGIAEDLFPQFGAGAKECVKDPNHILLGLMGADSSSHTQELHKFAATHNLPLVSYIASAPLLSNVHTYPNLMRTIPPDGPLTQAIVAMAETLEWDYVVVVYTDNTYGRGAYYEIRPRLDAAGICLTAAFSVDPEDDTSATMQNLLDKILATDTVGVVYLGGSMVARGILNTANGVAAAGKLQWIFTDSVSTSETFPGLVYPRGLVAVLPAARKITEFEDHWVKIDVDNPSPENPWYREMYMASHKCYLPGVTGTSYADPCPVTTETERREEFVQDQFVEPAVHAVFTYARALKQAHLDLCGGVSGMCDPLRQLSTADFYQNYMRNIDFTYMGDERVESLASAQLEPYLAPARVKYNGNDIINPSFDIYSFNDYNDGVNYKFENVGSYFNNRAEIVTNKLIMYDESRQTRLVDLPASVCPAVPCSPCLRATIDAKYLYMPGDVVINGMFSIHNAGDMPMSCGEFNTDPYSGIQLLEAMVYAVHRINSIPNILDGVTVGMLGFDDCKSSILSNQLLSEVQRHSRLIVDENNVPLDPRRIEGYIGGTSSERAISMADLMNTIMRPMMGYGGLTESLKDQAEFPYFIRSHHSIMQLSKAMVLAVKRNSWKYVQVVHNPGRFGMEAMDAFRRSAAEEGICVVASYEMETMVMEDIVHKLRSRPEVQPVVVLTEDHAAVTSFLQSIKATNATGEFQLLSMIGNDMQTVKGVEQQADGMISVRFWEPSLGLFRGYLRDLDVNTYTRNPWFKEWYETVYDCKYNPARGETACPDRKLVNEADFQFSQLVVTVISGMISFAYGLDETLKHYCGQDYVGVCGDFANARGKGQLLLEKISEVVFEEDGADGSNLVFRYSHREGNIPFKYYNYKAEGNEFKDVGTFRPNEDVFDMEDFTLVSPLVTSKCQGLCLECLYMFRFQKFMYIPGDLLIPAIFDVHYRGDSPFSCGDTRLANGWQYTEAFRFALSRINGGLASVKLNGVQLGGLGFDGCTDSVRASALVTGLYSTTFPQLRLENTNLNIYDLMAWMSYDSDSTVKAASILQRFGIPAVSPGATTPELDDKDKYTTFFRTVPSDGVIAKGMALLSRKLGFSYIITINAPDAGSRAAVEEFRKYAEEQGICIGASYEFETDGTEENIFSYIEQSTTQIVAVFAEPDRYITELLRIRAESPQGSAIRDIYFISNRPWTQPASQTEQPLGSITFKMDATSFLTTFQNFLSTQQPVLTHPNPWIREFYEDYFKCKLAGTYKYEDECNYFINTLENMPQDIWVLPTINAVYAIAEGIHLTLQQKCGTNYNGLCSAFRSDPDTYQTIMANMDVESFNDMTNSVFEFLEREANYGVVFTRFTLTGEEQREGTFTNDVMSFRDETEMVSRFSLVRAQCVGKCLQCEKKDAGDIEYMFLNGDIIIGGLFDIHKEGNTPYRCGELNDVHGFELLEAFNWAVDYVNLKQGEFEDMLDGVRIGTLSFDTCKSAVRAGNLVANFHTRNFVLDTKDYTIDPSLIDVYVGPLTSESSIRVADVLGELGIPQISYGASSLNLQDYKYFLRSVPADDKQARALIAFLKEYEYDNVQVISQFTTNGIEGVKEFLRLAPLNRICVTAEHVIGHSGDISDTEANLVVSKLWDTPDAKVVILWMDNPYALLRAADRMMYMPGNFSFVATDKLGYGIMGYENLHDLYNLSMNGNVVTLDIESADIVALDQYLEHLVPDTYTRNPWYRDYFEFIYDCSLSGPTVKYPKTCPDEIMGISRAEKYIQDPYALYVIDAVFSIARGAHRALADYCGGDYYGLCNIFRTSGEKRELLLKEIKGVNFIDNSLQPFYYLPTGESDRGYHLYKPVRDPYQVTNFIWNSIGHYNDTDFLKMEAAYDPGWESDCEQSGSCQCEFPAYQPSRYFKQESPLDLNVVMALNIHKQDPSSDLACGAIDDGSNFQNLMAFIYAINLVNENADNRFPGSLKLGGIGLDTCSQPYRIGEDVYSLLSGEPVCGLTNAEQAVKPSSVVAYMSTNSANSLAVSSILSPLKITTLSSSATSVELSDKLSHSYFLRTVPPDNIQAIVIANILNRFAWDYVSVVYADNAYGRSAVDTLLRTAENADVVTCIGLIHAMPLDAGLDEAKDVIDILNQQIGARVIVLFVTREQARYLLEATKDKGLNSRFVWVGSDRWANDEYIVNGLEETAAGAITVQIQSEFSQGFHDFMKTLTFNNRHGLPDDWFEELYQTLHECRIQTSVVQQNYRRICTENEVITDDMIPQDPFVLHTIIAIFQIASGLSDLEVCKQTGLTIASCLSLQEDRSDKIYNAILNAQHTVLPDDLESRAFNFKFTSDGYGDIGYNILNYRRNFTTSQYEYAVLGTYLTKLDLDPLKYQSYNPTELAFPYSRCSPGSICSCLRQDLSRFTLSRREPGVQYYRSNEGLYVDPDTGEEVVIEGAPQTADRFRDIWALIVVTLAAIGAFATLCLFIYLLVVYPVRGGTSVLGYMLCFGIVLMYVLVFAFVAHATKEVCAIRRFCLGLIYSIVYAALFVKLVDCWRTNFKEDIYSVKYTKIGNPWGLFCSALLIVVVQVIINTEWLILQIPDTTTVVYNNMIWPRCTPDDFYDEGLILSNLFVMFLIFLCIIMGLAAFGNDKNHWDSRWILGCVVLTVPSWMVWCLVASLGEYKMRDAAAAIGLLFNATVMLLCGPMRKLYLLNKFQAAQAEEEEQLAASQQDYNAYEQHYDNAPQLHEGSVRGSMAADDVFYDQARS